MIKFIRGLAALLVVLGVVIGGPIALVRFGRLDAFAQIDWGRLFSTPDDGLNVYESKWGEPIGWVYEYRRGTVINQERYESDKAFAQTYGLQVDD